MFWKDTVYNRKEIDGIVANWWEFGNSENMSMTPKGENKSAVCQGIIIEQQPTIIEFRFIFFFGARFPLLWWRCRLFVIYTYVLPTRYGIRAS